MLIEQEGESELKELEAELKSADSKTAEKKEASNELQQLLTAVSSEISVSPAIFYYARSYSQKMCNASS